jgi:hypothetical protein
MDKLFYTLEQVRFDFAEAKPDSDTSAWTDADTEKEISRFLNKMYDMNKGNYRDLDGVIAKVRKVNDDMRQAELAKVKH